MKLKMVKKYAAFELGEEVEFSDHKAQRLIKKGIGEAVLEQKQTSPKKRKAKGAK